LALADAHEWAGENQIAMPPNPKIIDALPKLLERLSNGKSLHIPTLSEELGIAEKTIQDNIKKNLQPLEIAEIRFDRSTQHWIARKNFLSETLLSADEIVTMQLLTNHSNTLSNRFQTSTKRLFNRFIKRASLSIFKKTKIEKITKDDEGKLAIIKTAISQKRILHCIYKEKKRIIHPLKIVLLEGYWYLFFWDTAYREIRKYHLKTMEALDIQDETFDAPTSHLIDKLDNAINAYFKDDELIPVELLLHKNISKYFHRQPLSPSQKITRYNDDYEQMNITITDEMEIIPTIQQFLPYIKVLSPDSLHLQIEENIKNYSQIELQ